MPTAQPPGLTGQDPHEARQMAESFGVDPERYDRARPDYPEAMVRRIVTASPGRDVLDVGCGTGISARAFQAAGCNVLGLDVDARMAGFARRRGLEVQVAAFETWEPAGRAFDAVVSGQSWHWVDPLLGAVKAVRALRPGGRLAVFWNVQQPPPEVAEAFSEVYRRVAPEMPVFNRRGQETSPDRPSPRVGYTAQRSKAADGMRRSGGFQEPQQWRFDWERLYTREQWLEQVPTFGGHGRFAPAKLAELLEGVGAAIDAAGGSFTMRYVTMVVTAVRAEPA
jgi:SAM-dependent methyltransferase